MCVHSSSNPRAEEAVVAGAGSRLDWSSAKLGTFFEGQGVGASLTDPRAAAVPEEPSVYAIMVELIGWVRYM